MRGLSLVAASGGHPSSQCAGLSLSRPLLLRSSGSRRAGSVVVAHGPSCSAACGIFPDQGWNPCPLHRQADSQPLRHQGSPAQSFNTSRIISELLCAYHYITQTHFNKFRICLQFSASPKTEGLLLNVHKLLGLVLFFPFLIVAMVFL